MTHSARQRRPPSCTVCATAVLDRYSVLRLACLALENIEREEMGRGQTFSIQIKRIKLRNKKHTRKRIRYFYIPILGILYPSGHEEAGYNTDRTEHHLVPNNLYTCSSIWLRQAFGKSSFLYSQYTIKIGNVSIYFFSSFFFGGG